MSTADGSPLISVVVCTRNSPGTFRRALDSVLLQDMADFEVVIVDDGSDAPLHVPTRWEGRIRIIRLPHRGVGAARHEGLHAARGLLVAYCDDDDEWSPDHLRILSTYLMEHASVDLVYGDSQWTQNGVRGAIAYSINYDAALLAHSNYIFATDVMHRARAAREVGGFNPALRAYEDWDLWLRMSHRNLFRHIPAVLATHHWHHGSVSAADHWEDWQYVHQAHQRRLIQAGLDAQHGLLPDAAPSTPFNPETWRPERRELVWHSLLRENEGYGSAGRQLLLALDRQGVAVTMAPTRNQPPVGFERFFRPLDHWGRIAFYYDYRVRPSVLKSSRVINYSMWESTRVPADHVAEINTAAVLQCVPCRQNAESFRQSGVRTPIKVLHHGVDPAHFPYLSRRHPDSFTFGTFGDLSPRKGIDVLIRAFEEEFTPTEPVRLLMKTTTKFEHGAIRDPRIKLISGFMDQPTLLEFLGQLDAFVLPSRGEGFGLCGLEAMSTGLPLIATDWGGPAEYLDPQDSFPLSYRLVDARGIASNQVRYFGSWAEPDLEHLRYLMRWLYEHPAEAAARGRLAARRVHSQWTWDRVARDLRDIIDALAA